MRRLIIYVVPDVRTATGEEKRHAVDWLIICVDIERLSAQSYFSIRSAKVAVHLRLLDVVFLHRDCLLQSCSFPVTS